MGEQDQRWRMDIRPVLRWWMIQLGIISTGENEAHRHEKKGISISNLPGRVDADLGKCRDYRLRVRIGQRNGIAVIVFGIDRVRVSGLVVRMRVAGGSVMIMMMIQVQHFQPNVMMKCSRPDHEG